MNTFLDELLDGEKLTTKAVSLQLHEIKWFSKPFLFLMTSTSPIAVKKKSLTHPWQQKVFGRKHFSPD